MQPWDRLPYLPSLSLCSCATSLHSIFSWRLFRHPFSPPHLSLLLLSDARLVSWHVRHLQHEEKICWVPHLTLSFCLLLSCYSTMMGMLASTYFCNIRVLMLGSMLAQTIPLMWIDPNTSYLDLSWTTLLKGLICFRSDVSKWFNETCLEAANLFLFCKMWQEDGGWAI